MRTGFDLSNYDVPLDKAAITALQAGGMTFTIVGCQQPDIASAQVISLQAVGIPVVGTYAFLYWGLNTTGQTQAAINVAKANGVPYVWLDCEAAVPNEASGQTPESRTEQLRECVAMVESAGLKAGIYTGTYYWPSAMGGTTEWARLPLWHASYYNDRRYEPAVNYGGWTQVAIHQFATTPAIAGRDRDYDVMFDWFEQEAFPPATTEPQQEVDDMTPEEVTQLIDQRVAWLWTQGAPPTLPHFVSLIINPAPGGFSDGNGGLLPAVQDQALVARVAALENAPKPEPQAPAATVSDDAIRTIARDELAKATIVPGGAA